MAFCALPVFLAFLLNRCSIRFFTSCRCLLGFTPFSASVLFGLSLVTLIVKHPQLYPCWLRRVNCKLMFFYELFVSIVFIEIGYCLWNSLETFLFYKIPSFLEEHCSPLGDLYINTVESPVGVSLISNTLALTLLFLALHTTRICNFSLLFRSNGVHKFFADAGLTTSLCKHHRDVRCGFEESERNLCCRKPVYCPPPLVSRPVSAVCCTPRSPVDSSPAAQEPVPRCPKTLRSGKKIY